MKIALFSIEDRRETNLTQAVWNGLSALKGSVFQMNPSVWNPFEIGRETLAVLVGDRPRVREAYRSRNIPVIVVHPDLEETGLVTLELMAETEVKAGEINAENSEIATGAPFRTFLAHINGEVKQLPLPLKAEKPVPETPPKVEVKKVEPKKAEAPVSEKKE